MKNPKINRIVGYVVLFIGFFLFYKGFHYPTQDDPVNGHNPILIGISIVYNLRNAIELLFTISNLYNFLFINNSFSMNLSLLI